MDDYPYDLVPYTRKITSSNAAAQLWFVRGLNWCFGFHHEEAAFTIPIGDRNTRRRNIVRC